MLTSKKPQAVPSFDDIVFENRNRNYGAYKLRRDYDGNVIKAFLITVGAVLLITGHSLIKDLFVNKEAAPLEVNLDVITFQRPPEILDAKPENAPIKKEKPEPASGGTKETIPVIVPIDSIPELSAKDTASTSPGPGPSTGKVTLPFKPGGNADSTAGSAGVIPAKKEPTDYPDIMPEFPGGDAELFRYLGKSIKYPKIPLQEGIQANVHVAFVVGEDGNISDIEIIRPGGYGFDEEVIRVVKKMPRWKAGKLKGKDVAVRFRMPVKFKLQRN